MHHERPIKRFPVNFMFQLTRDECGSLRLQMESSQKSMSSQFVMTYPGRRPNSTLPIRISGHKRIKDFYKYIRISPEEAANEIKELWIDGWDPVSTNQYNNCFK